MLKAFALQLSLNFSKFRQFSALETKKEISNALLLCVFARQNSCCIRLKINFGYSFFSFLGKIKCFASLRLCEIKFSLHSIKNQFWISIFYLSNKYQMLCAFASLRDQILAAFN